MKEQMKAQPPKAEKKPTCRTCGGKLKVHTVRYKGRVTIRYRVCEACKKHYRSVETLYEL